MLRSIFIILLMACPVWAAEEAVLRVEMRADQVSALQDLGSMQVEGVGMVSFSARRDGTQIIVQARRQDGSVVGKAESVIGVNEAPIYLQTPQGLKKLTILWKGP